MVIYLVPMRPNCDTRSVYCGGYPKGIETPVEPEKKLFSSIDISFWGASGNKPSP